MAKDGPLETRPEDVERHPPNDNSTKGSSSAPTFASANGGSSSSRRMVRAELLGGHTHETADGKKVHVWLRDDKYLARGRHHGRPFGESLGADIPGASSRLCQLLVDLKNGAFVRPSERPRRMLGRELPRLTVRQLCDDFLTEKRRVRGRRTTGNYRSRLVPVIEFAERTSSMQTWPLAMDVDREFALQLKATLDQRLVTRNGRAGGNARRISPTQVYHILDTLRSVLNWAKRPEIFMLPLTFANPITEDVLGGRSGTDPLRSSRLPLSLRLQVVRHMDAWQVLHLALPMLLPLRPEDFVGLLISEVDLEEHIVRFGTRLSGRDFTKGRQSFVCPFPAQIAPLLLAMIGDRHDGPLLRRRPFWEGQQCTDLDAATPAELLSFFDRELAAVPPGTVQTSQDQKVFFRQFLRRLGGVTGDLLSKSFKGLIQQVDPQVGVRFYDLRGSINTEMNAAGVSHLVQRYVTGHATNDILNDYVSLDPVIEMQKYFASVRPLVEAIVERAQEFKLISG